MMLELVGLVRREAGSDHWEVNPKHPFAPWVDWSSSSFNLTTAPTRQQGGQKLVAAFSFRLC
jgi:hypothetical protein